MDECPDVLFGTETSVPKVTGYTVEWKEASETWDDAQSTTIASLNTRRGIRSLNPNPPMDTDGRREDTGRGVRKLTEAMVRARIRVDGRLEAVAGAFGGADGGLQWLW